jgi:hypothetical protein
VHAADPLVALNVPAAHAATLVPSPVWLASATQSDRASEPVAVTPVLAGQAVQSVSASWPSDPLNLPAGQLAHDAEPIAAL